MRKLICTFSLLAAALGGSHAVAATCNGVAANLNLVANCGFETGTFTGSYGGSATTDGFSGIDSGDPFAIGPTPYEGSYEAYLGNVGAVDSLTQTLSTVAGQNYLVEFALLNDYSYTNPYPNSFSVTFGGTTLFSETDVAADAYTLYSFVGTAASSSTVLSFNERNDDGYFELDSISASQTPEPGSLALLGTGILGLSGLVRRHRGRTNL